MHTPGPWHLWQVGEDTADFTAISTRPAPPHLDECAIDLSSEVLGSSEWMRWTKEDAQLMAAAPELLEACEEALAMVQYGTDITLMAMLSAAITKARQGH